MSAGAGAGTPEQAPRGPRVHELRLVVTAADYADALSFYRDTLGLPELAAFSDEGGRVAILDAGAATLEIADERHAAYVDRVEVGRRVAGHIRVAFRVDDAAQTLSVLQAHGAMLVAEATRTPWGSRNGRLNGPADLHLTVFSDEGKSAPLEAPRTLAASERGPDPIAPVAGIAVRDLAGRLLLVRRTIDAHWGLPGGHLEFGESFSDCARREFREETGADVELTGMLGAYSDPATQTYPLPDGTSVQYVGVIFEGRMIGAIGTWTDDVTDVQWFDPRQLPSPVWEPDLPVIADALTLSPRPFIR